MAFCVVDTSVASMMFQNRPELAAYAPHLLDVTVAVSFQTVAEMRLGCRIKRWGPDRTASLEAFLSSLVLVGYTDRMGHCWAQIMDDAKGLGRRLEAADAWIAATALLLSVPLLTHDKDFAVESCPAINVIRYTA
jgi:predicted nucleic acid-binding protein